MNLEQYLEALLFWKGEPMSLKELNKSLAQVPAFAGLADGEIGANEVSQALASLEKSLQSRGLVLLYTNGEYSLGTSPEASSLIEKLTKEELSRDLGRASLETLSIILYKGPIKRSEIDYIRGVNSSFILRNLLIRGLIEKKPAPNDNRTSVYSTSFELLSYLGISKIEDLPNFALVQEEIARFNNDQESEMGQSQIQNQDKDQAQAQIQTQEIDQEQDKVNQ